MNIKMMVTDLDGTLLREDETVSSRTVSVLQRCRDKGIKIVYATGRGSSADDVVKPIVFDGRIRVNGATAFAGDVPIYRKWIHTNEIRDMLLAADAAGIKIVAEYMDHHYSNFDFREIWPWLEGYVEADFKELDTDIEKIYSHTEIQANALPFFEKHLPKGTYLSVTRDGTIMMLREGAAKSQATAALAKHWNIKPEEIVAFGDDLNDLDLLKYAGTAVVMKDGLDQAKAIADEICGSNENDGLAKWMEERVL